MGTWLNYATTILFQILFARAYGATPDASAFVVVLGIAIAVGGLFISTSQSLAIPRLLTAEGSLRTGSLKFLAAVAIVATTVLGTLGLAAGPLAGPLASLVDADLALLRDLLRLAALFAFLQLVAGQVAVICLARGARFIPAVAPAFPSLVGAAWLLLHSESDPRSTFGVMCAGAFLQVLFLVGSLHRPIRLEASRLPNIGALGVMTAGQLVLLSSLPLIERLLASTAGADGAARYDYATRSLVAVQQLLVGGVLMASLADWSRRPPSNRRLASRLIPVGGALLGAAVVAAVSAPNLVRFIYERGNFTQQDTEAVAWLLRLALPGFVAGGVGLVFSQALLSERRNAEAITLGVARFGVRLGVAAAMTAVAGLKGLVLGVSVVECVTLVVQASVWGRLIRLPCSGRPARALAAQNQCDEL